MFPELLMNPQSRIPPAQTRDLPRWSWHTIHMINHMISILKMTGRLKPEKSTIISGDCKQIGQIHDLELRWNKKRETDQAKMTQSLLKE